MVAIVSGYNLGLNFSSLAALGRNGQFGVSTLGNNRERSYVNVSTGNLVLQDMDTTLIGLGVNTGALRTYNSQGQFDFDNNDGWQGAPYKSIKDLGNGKLIRTDVDGSTTTYVWDQTKSAYIATTGAGSALDSITSANGIYTWTDGATGNKETYQGTGAGLILSGKDTSGNAITYSYTNNQLTRITNANGEWINFTYTGNNLTQVSTTLQSGQIVSQVSYTYDALNRLSSVSVNLNQSNVPGGSESGTSYITTYTYDGTSDRVASVTQSDGTTESFTYVLVNGSYKIDTVTDGLGLVTHFGYDPANNTTTVTDPEGISSVYKYDNNGQLLQVKTGVTPSNPNGLTQTSYTYNALGDVLTVTDGLGHKVTMAYDANGNQVSQVDSGGNTITRTYNAQNQLLTETFYAAAASIGSPASQPLTTRYIYDANNKNLLRYVITAEGRVTEYRYNSSGLRISAIQYTSNSYDLSGWSNTAVPTEAQMQSWSAVQNLSLTARTDMTYDFRGQLVTQTIYASVDSAGNGISDKAQINLSLYDQKGELLQLVSFNASSPNLTLSEVTQYIYDGLGRVVSSSRRALDGSISITTATQYDDAHNKVTVTQTNGLSTISVFNRRGELITVSQNSPTNTVLGITQYFYDADGHLLMSQDPTGVKHWMLYDSAGRKVGDIDGTGSLTEYVYNADNQITETIAYITRVDFTKLVDAGGKPTTGWSANPGAAPAGSTIATLASLRPAPSTLDQKSWNFYDSANRLYLQVDALGYLTQTSYDGASRITAVTRYAHALNAVNLGNGQSGLGNHLMDAVGEATAIAGVISVNANGDVEVFQEQQTADRTTSYIYDKDGLLRAIVDAKGYLTEYRYNAGGERVQAIQYANVVSHFINASDISTVLTNARKNDSLVGLIPAASSSDITTYTFYNARGQVSAVVDGEGYLTEYVYDGRGNLTQTIRYANKAKTPVIASSQLAAIRPTSNSEDHVTSNTWDALNRLVAQTNAEGTITQYSYDSSGHLISTSTAFNTADVRTLMYRYDVQGRIVGELSAAGAALLTGNQTQSDIDAIWVQYGTTYTYDAAGRRTSTIDANGNRSIYFYDEAGRLRYTVNAMGEIEERQYDALGHLTSTSQLATHFSPSSITGFIGGVLSAPENIRFDGLMKSIKVLDKPNTTTTQYSYDAKGELVQTQDANGGLTNYSYDAFGDIRSTTQTIDATHSTTTINTYDRRGLVTKTIADIYGIKDTTSIIYDAFGRAISITAHGATTRQTFDHLGRVVQLSGIYQQHGTSYDAFDRVLTQNDSFGNVTRYFYDTANRSVTVTAQEGVSITTVHNRFGQTLSFKDGNGNVTSFTYDMNGNLVRTNTQLTQTSSKYDHANRLYETTDANRNITHYDYDAANRLITRTVDPTGLALQTSYQYDAKGRQISITDAKGIVTKINYDLKGQVTSQVVDPTGLNLITSFTYDQRGEQLTITSPGGTVTKYVYDSLGRRIEEHIDANGLNLTRKYTYDQNGNVANMIDANGNITRYVYDAANRMIYTIDAVGDITSYGYNAENQVTFTKSYTKSISLSGLGNIVSQSDIQSRIVNSVNDSVVNRLYDKDGRITYTVDGTGSVTHYTYDKNGNVIDQVTYANRINLATWTSNTIPQVTADPYHDLEIRTIYDAANRAIYSINGIGAVIRNIYDGAGNLLERIAYAKVIDHTTPATAAAISAAVLKISDITHDNYNYYNYDRAGRLIWSVNALGAVTQNIYDNNNNLIKQIAYATLLTPDQSPTTLKASVNDRVTVMAFDNANRLTWEVDALGGVTNLTYDANGNLTQQIQYANRVAAPTNSGSIPTAASLGASIQALPPGADRKTLMIYDTANRQVFNVNAMGAVVETRYDAVGNIIATVRYANLLTSFTALAPISHISDIASQLVADSANDRATQHIFDAANHLIFNRDALGYITQNRYDGIGRIVGTTAYAQAIGATVANTITAISAALVSNVLADRTNGYVYDALGNLISSTDALSHTEFYSWNGRGLKTSFTNKNNATWGYDYDAAGRLTTETAPPVSIDTVTTDANGNLIANSIEPSVSLVTRFSYDALGNLTSRTEAFGRPEQRTTMYQYDAIGHQVKTIYPSVAVYNAAMDNPTVNGANSVAARTDALQTLTTQVIYDVFGEAVVNVDVNGNYSYKTYNSLGQLSYEVDALGYVTGYQRDTFGGTTSLTRYAVATSLNSNANIPLLDAQITQTIAPLSHDADRTITTVCDQLGRVSKVNEPATWTINASGTGRFTSKQTNYGYNAFNNTSVSVLYGGDISTMRWTRHYFDQKGQEIGTGDAMGYITTQQFDAVGNVIQQTQYANALPGNFPPGGLVIPTASTDDRTTIYSYDLANRKTSETRVNVEYSTASDGTSARGNLTTTYGYDSVGNLTRTTDPLSHSTYSYYDALGRVTAVASPDRSSTVDGSVLIPLTQFRRDAYGNVTVKIDYANSASNVSNITYARGNSSVLDHITLTQYDSHGSATQIADANGVNHFMSYDAAGHLAKQWQGISGNDGITHTSFTVFQYDALGNQTDIFAPASTSVVSGNTIINISQQAAGLVRTQMVYNGFGDMVKRGTYTGATPQLQEYFDYDNAGRLWRTNSGDGVDKIYLYDAWERISAQIESAGSQGSSTDMGFNIALASSAQQVATTSIPLRRIDYLRDRLGHIVQETLPSRFDQGLSTSVRPIVYQTVDRWGNVLTQTDVRNSAWVTQYRYNADNKVIQEIQPDSNGAISSNSPVTQIYYNAMGRQVAIRDANNNVNGQRYDGAGNLSAEIHADGGTITHRYDAFGNQIKQTDAMGDITTYAYDKLNQTTSITNDNVGVYSANTSNAISGSQQNLVTTMGYDQAGRKLWQTNGNNETIQYTYDLRGNIIATRQPLGQLTLDTFDAQGHQTAELDANGSLATWGYDSFGELQTHTDIGGAAYWFHYDNARQLIANGNTRGQNITYGYDGAGQLINITDITLNKITAYAYNYAGRHIHEQTAQNGQLFQDQIIAYDTLGRMAQVDNSVDSVSVHYDYDEVGNRIHQHQTWNTTHYHHDIDHYINGDPIIDEHGNITGYQQIPVYVDHYDTVGHTQDLWYAYDSMNRQIMSDGAYNGNANDVANITSGQGHILTYDKNGNRTSDTFWGSQVVRQESNYGGDENNPPSTSITYANHTGRITEWYTYDKMNRLSTVATGAYDTNWNPLDRSQAILLDTRLYDGASRVVQTGPNGTLPNDYINALNHGNSNANGAITRISRYDADGRLLTQHVTLPDGSFDYDITYQKSDGSSGYDAAGNVLAYRVYDHNGITQTYDYASVKLEGYKEGTITGKRSDANSSGTTTDAYDANGFLISVTDSTNGAKNRTLINDAQGHILQKSQNGSLVHTLVINGEVTATYGAGVDPVDGASFDLSYQPITNTYPSAATGSYAIQAGDTLQNIAQRAYGDSDMWYQIADANGVSGNSDLRVGETITIPSRVASVHNNANTFAPYNPSAIIGSTSPTLPVPQATSSGGGGGCGGLGSILTIVVAIAVSVLVPEAIEPALDAALGATAGGIAGAAIGAAAGSIASQAFGEAIGQRDSFSWEDVGLSALSAGVSAGIGGVNPVTTPGTTTIDIGRAIANAALGNALTQGISVAVGLQSSFNWRNVAASAIGAGVGAEVGNAVGSALPKGLTNFENSFIKGSAAGLAGGFATALAHGGKIEITQIATDAFGHALGNSFASDIAGASGGTQTASLKASINLLQTNFAGERDNIDYQPTDFSPQNNASGMKFSQIASTGSTYTVQEGDNLFRIAQNLYGDGNQLGAIVAANKLSNPNLLKVGTELSIPTQGTFDSGSARDISNSIYAWNAQNEAIAQANAAAQARAVYAANIASQANQSQGSTDVSVNGIAQSRASTDAYWQGVQDNAVANGSPLTYIGAHFMQLFGQSGHDLANAAVGVYNLATSSDARAAAVNSISYAATHPDVVINGIAQSVSDFAAKPFGEEMDSVFKFGVTSLATLGVSKPLFAAGELAVDGAITVGGAVYKALAPVAADFAYSLFQRLAPVAYIVENTTISSRIVTGALDSTEEAATINTTQSISKGAIQNYWPPNAGFLGSSTPETLDVGYQFSRYGGFFDNTGNFQDFGNFVSPSNVPYGMRALPFGTDLTKPLSFYEVLKPITDVPTGTAAPAFGELGLGIQHELPLTIQDYLDQGYIRLMNQIIPRKP